MRTRWGVVVVVALALTLLVAACGDDEAQEAPDPTPTPEATPEPEPEPEPETYTVEQGDTLSRIAQRHDTTVEAITEANDIENPDLIRPGQELIIPPTEEP